ncbi:MAG: DUF3048 domain-containing protein [Anaerolineales bacterium]|nr:DUF3048 domain-containing protein [Anaerolineales bacterium]
MRKKYINYTAALALAFTFMVGARCIRVYMETLVVSAAAEESNTDLMVALITEECDVIPTDVVAPTEIAVISTPTITIPTPTPTPYIYGGKDIPEGINPLTGLTVDDPSLLARRPMVIKITNFPRGVRPQWGLNLADHVYEYYIGDGLSRFIAVFYGQDAERVGPVRSARLFDEHIMRMYNGIFVFAYADDRVLEELVTPELSPYLVIETKRNCPPLCRKEHHGMASNNLFADTRYLGEYVSQHGGDNVRPDLGGLFFSPQIPAGGSYGEKAVITYTYASYHYWEYDPERNKYLRFQEVKSSTGQTELEYLPLLDSLDLEQVSADNLIVLQVAHETVYESSSTLIFDMPFTHDGKGYAFRDGQIFPINWITNGKNHLISIYDLDGREYPLKPGNVWFEIIGKTSIIEYGENSSWNFTFQMP